jgi:hypothetical protein
MPLHINIVPIVAIIEFTPITVAKKPLNAPIIAPPHKAIITTSQPGIPFDNKSATRQAVKPIFPPMEKSISPVTITIVSTAAIIPIKERLFSIGTRFNVEKKKGRPTNENNTNKTTRTINKIPVLPILAFFPGSTEEALISGISSSYLK